MTYIISWLLHFQSFKVTIFFMFLQGGDLMLLLFFLSITSRLCQRDCISYLAYTVCYLVHNQGDHIYFITTKALTSLYIFTPVL
jgi:hypothetical protein